MVFRTGKHGKVYNTDNHSSGAIEQRDEKLTTHQFSSKDQEEKLKLIKDQQYSDNIDKWNDNTGNIFENTIMRKITGLSPQGISKIKNITDGQRYNLETMLNNDDWGTIQKEQGHDGVKRAINEIKKSVTDSSLYLLEQAYGRIDMDKRTAWNPSGRENPFNELFANFQDEDLAKQKNRDMDYQMSKRILKESIDETIQVALHTLPKR